MYMLNVYVWGLAFKVCFERPGPMLSKGRFSIFPVPAINEVAFGSLRTLAVAFAEAAC